MYGIPEEYTSDIDVNLGDTQNRKEEIEFGLEELTGRATTEVSEAEEEEEEEGDSINKTSVEDTEEDFKIVGSDSSSSLDSEDDSDTSSDSNSYGSLQ